MGQLVSAIITTYKRPKAMVIRAINSVLSQTYSNLELIVVDDSPNDFEERQDIKLYIETLADSRIRLIQHEENMGACAARNTGIKSANGDFIAFLDDDDVWHDDKLELQVEKMNSGDYGLVYCRQHVINEVKNTEYYPQKNYYEGEIFDQLVLTNFVGSTSFALVKKWCFERVGMFDTSMPASQDFEMWLRIAKEYSIGFVDKPLVDYYIHVGDNITGNYKKKLEAIERLLEINSEYFQTHSNARSIRYLNAAPYYALNKKYGMAIKYYSKGVFAKPLEFKRNVVGLAKILRAIFQKVV